jgi:3-oxoacyl-[acyl-carrier protein] reductase
MDLTNKVALVTGSRRGLGKAIAQRLAQAGADIVINDIEAGMAEAEATAAEIAALGRRTTVITGDVSQGADADRLIETCVERMGRLDILVNNAGVTRDSLLIRMTDEQWKLVLDINLTGTFNCTRAAARPMMKQRGGKIVNIASVVGLMGNVGQANYAASKGGVIALTKATAKELAPRGIQVNAVAPGFIVSAMTDQLSEEARARLMALIPLARLGTADDVAEAVAFLASSSADYITGQVLPVDGGMVM